MNRKSKSPPKKSQTVDLIATIHDQQKELYYAGKLIKFLEGKIARMESNDIHVLHFTIPTQETNCHNIALNAITGGLILN